MVPMVMDYYGTLYFFIGDIFYAINSEGELLLERRVTIPEVPVMPGQYLRISNGPVDRTGTSWSNATGAPVLHTDGTITVAYGILMPSWTDELIRTGIVRLSRSGSVLETGHFPWKSNSPERVLYTRLAGTRSGRLAVSGQGSSGFLEPLNGEEQYNVWGTFYALNELDPFWNMEIPFGYSEISGRESDEIETDLAIGPDERAYGMTYHGKVYAFDIHGEMGKPIFNFNMNATLSWQNRPIIAENGTMYLTNHGYPLGPGMLWAMDTEKLWNEPVAQRPNPWQIPDPADYEGLKWRKVYGGSGGWSTPVLSKNGRLYEAMGGLGALDPETGEQIWRFGERTMASAPTILSDGTIVVGQGITGRIFFLKEDTPNGGMADAGWPGAMHDHYLSNNAAHPFRWDRSAEAPYPPLEELLDAAGPCWNEVGWDIEACGPLPDHRDRDSDAGLPDVEDAGRADATMTPDSDDEPASSDVVEEDTQSPPMPRPHSTRGCTGCSAAGEPSPTPLLFLLSLLGGMLFLRAISRRLARS